MPVRRPAQLLACIVGVLAVAGCGSERTLPPEVVVPGPPLGTTPSGFAAVGLAFAAPAGWNLQPGAAPLVATITTGRATIAVYRYPRTEELPRSRGELDAALTALTDAAKLRDATYSQLKRAQVRVDGRPAVVLRATETVGDQQRTVRSTHVYAFGGEVVVDAFAPAADFKRIDASAFRPFVRSLKLTKPAA